MAKTTTTPTRVLEIPTVAPRTGKALNPRYVQVAKAIAKSEGGAHVADVAKALDISAKQVRGAIDQLRAQLDHGAVARVEGKVGFFAWRGVMPASK